MSDERIILGIDFGTTNCSVGRIRSDGLLNTLGPLPSIGVWSNEKLYFGKEAVQQLQSGRDDIYPVRDLKLLLGTDNARVGHLSVDPVQIATGLFKKIVSEILGDEKADLAVVGSPVRMPREHRVALREAAMGAGIGGIRLVYEPTAALIGALREQDLPPRSQVLVVDWGGGTLDVAVIKHTDGLYQEIGVDGDIADLGGSRIDDELTNSLLRENPVILNAVNEKSGRFELLREQVEQEKINILTDLDGEDGEPVFIAPPWLPKPLRLDPKLVYKVMREFADKAHERILRVLHNAGIQSEHITHILFAGGTCRTNVVQKSITDAFKHAQAIKARNPQVLTGEGCTLLASQDFSIELAADFTVRQADDTLCMLLPRGQRLETGRYRRADFMVTDVHANEAVFDFGVCHFDTGRRTMLSADILDFQSLCQLFVQTGTAETSGGALIPDSIRLHVGIDENLTAALHIKSNRGGSVQEFISSVPLAIRVGGDFVYE